MRRFAACRRSVNRQPLADLRAPVGRGLIVAASGTLQGDDAALDRIADLPSGHAQVVLWSLIRMLCCPLRSDTARAQPLALVENGWPGRNLRVGC
jgi:hypothetical protein